MNVLTLVAMVDGYGLDCTAEQAALLEVIPSREYRTLVSSSGAVVGAIRRLISVRMVAC